MTLPIITAEIRSPQDVVLLRQRTVHVAMALGFTATDQVQIATAVSEVARHALQYTGGGNVELSIRGQTRLVVCVNDRGPSIPHLDEIVSGSYLSETGLGSGILTAKKLMDEFAIETTEGQGTSIRLSKRIPEREKIDAAHIVTILAQLANMPSDNPFDSLLQRNHELLLALEELERNRAQLKDLNRELDHTNRGVVALYAELEEKAEHLRHASDLKTRFLSNMTHEFRTPLNSILSLSRLLLDRGDGPLTSEQDKQVRYIQTAAEDLSKLVNDLLDLAKVEAGKLTVEITEFKLEEVFASLRGTLQPLLDSNQTIQLLFEQIDQLPMVRSDEAKVSQILRNLVSNALKFTQKGEVRVSARLAGTNQIEIKVSDTGIGIAPENHQTIFDEFVQIAGTHRNKMRGTGLGLPITKKLVELLGGEIRVQSELGSGAAFIVRLPILFAVSGDGARSGVVRNVDPLLWPVLVVDDSPAVLFSYDKLFRGTPFQSIPVYQSKDARMALQEFKPLAVVIEIPNENENLWALLHDIKTNPATEHIKVIIVAPMENRARAFEMGADECHSQQGRPAVVTTLHDFVSASPKPKILIVDDEEYGRYVVTNLFRGTKFETIEAKDGKEALALAKTEQPTAIILDLKMPGLDGFEVLKRLRRSSAMATIPVLIHSAKTLSAEQQKAIHGKAVLLDKDHVERDLSLDRLRQAMREAGLNTT